MLVRKIFCWLIQWTWGIIQNLMGLAVFLVHAGNRHYLYKEVIVTEWHRNRGLSLGMFVFVWPNDRRVVVHEYGHTIQSMMLGPLYLLVIGIPSALWCNLPSMKAKRMHNHIPYSHFYPERWANRLGEKRTGEKPL